MYAVFYDISITAKGMKSKMGHATLSVCTYLDAPCARRLTRSIDRLIKRGTRECIIDMSSVEAADSSGFGGLVAAARRLRKVGGLAVVVCSHNTLRRLFETTGLTRILPVVNRLENANAILAGATAGVLAS